MAQDFSQYRFKPLNEEQAAQAADMMAIGLGWGLPTGPQSMTWDDYQNWWLAALNDNKLKRKEWKDLGRRAGFSGRAARKAFKRGGRDWQSFLNDVIKPKLQKNSYIYRDPETGKVTLVSQGDMNYNEEAYNKASYKGTDPTKLANDFNAALDKARKEAIITYKQGKDGKWGYYTSYKVGDLDVNDLDVSNLDWFKLDTDRQKNAQTKAYGQAVDNYQGDFSAYQDDAGASLLKKIGYTEDVTDFDKKSEADQKTIKDNISSAIIKHYNELSKGSAGKVNWNDSIKADAWLKSMQEYYNNRGIKWLRPIAFTENSRYNQYSLLPTSSNSEVVGGAIGFSKNGGSLKSRVLAKGGNINMLRIGGNSWWRTVADFVPIVGTGLLAADKFIDNDESVGWGDLALSVGSDILTFIPGLGIAGAAAKAGSKALGAAGRIAGKAVPKVVKSGVKSAGKVVTKATKGLSQEAKLQKLQKQRLDLILKLRNYNATALQLLKKSSPKDKKAVRELIESNRKNLEDQLAKVKEKLSKIQSKSAERILREAAGEPSRSGKFIKNSFRTAAAGAGATYRTSVGARSEVTKQPAPEEESPETETSANTDASANTDTSIITDESGTVSQQDSTTQQYVPVTADRKYYSDQVAITGYNKQGGILKSLDNKFFKKGGKLKYKQIWNY